MLSGPINRDAFETFIERVLVPVVRPGDILVMDNLSSHKGNDPPDDSYARTDDWQAGRW